MNATTTRVRSILALDMGKYQRVTRLDRSVASVGRRRHGATVVRRAAESTENQAVGAKK